MGFPGLTGDRREDQGRRWMACQAAPEPGWLARVALTSMVLI
jgi:hypothetical protein